jgi:hypothetical protein
VYTDTVISFGTDTPKQLLASISNVNSQDEFGVPLNVPSDDKNNPDGRIFD